MRNKDSRSTPACNSHWLVRLVRGFYVAGRIEGYEFSVNFGKTINEEPFEKWAYGDYTLYLSVTFIKWTIGYQIHSNSKD